jgi:hypothetical protein
MIITADDYRLYAETKIWYLAPGGTKLGLALGSNGEEHINILTQGIKNKWSARTTVIKRDRVFFDRKLARAAWRRSQFNPRNRDELNARKAKADRVDGMDRDDLGESPDF